MGLISSLLPFNHLRPGISVSFSKSLLLKLLFVSPRLASSPHNDLHYKLRSIVGSDVARCPAKEEEIGQDTDQIDGLELAPNVDRQTFMVNSSIALNI